MTNTEKLIIEITKIADVSEGQITTAPCGTIYRYDTYSTKFKTTFTSLVNLFYKSAKDNGANNSPNFTINKGTINTISFHYDCPIFKGQPNGKISFKKLVILNSIKL